MIGKAIASLLTSHTALTALIPEERIFPYVLNENTPLPAIIYTIDTVSAYYSKDGWANDEVVFSVSTFSDDYARLQDIANEVRNALEWESGTVAGITLNKIRQQGLIEGFSISENVYVNRLTFNVIVNGY